MKNGDTIRKAESATASEPKQKYDILQAIGVFCLISVGFGMGMLSGVSGGDSTNDGSYYSIVTTFNQALLSEPTGLDTQVVSNSSIVSPAATEKSFLSETKSLAVSEMEKDDVGEVTVLYSIFTNEKDRVEEWLTSFKSSLLMSPLDRNLTFYILTDTKACKEIDAQLNSENMKLSEWKTRNKIKVNVIDVSNKYNEWKGKDATGQIHHANHTEGGSPFPFFAPSILPSSVEHALYMDSDSILLANLEEVWKYRNNAAMFQWGENEYVGFMILNLRLWKEREFWKLCKECHQKQGRNFAANLDDRSILAIFAKCNPELIGHLPKEWRDNDMEKWGNETQKLVMEKPQIGFAHFGNEHTTNKTANEGNRFESNAGVVSQKIWSVARFYASHPWPWVKYIMFSKARQSEQHQVLVEFKP